MMVLQRLCCLQYELFHAHDAEHERHSFADLYLLHTSNEFQLIFNKSSRQRVYLESIVAKQYVYMIRGFIKDIYRRWRLCL
jgi:hypothetical protein